MEVLWDPTTVSVKHWGKRLNEVSLRENGRRENGNQSVNSKNHALRGAEKQAMGRQELRKVI